MFLILWGQRQDGNMSCKVLAPKMSQSFTINSSAMGLFSSCECCSFKSNSICGWKQNQFFMINFLRISEWSTYQLSWSINQGSNHGSAHKLQNPPILPHARRTPCWNQSKCCKMKKCRAVITFETRKIFVGVTYSNQSNHVLWPRVDFPNSFVLNLSQAMFGLRASLRRCGPWKLTWPEPWWPISFSALDYSNNKAFPKLDTCLLYLYQTHPHVTGFGYQDPSNGWNHTATPLSNSTEKWWSESRIGRKRIKQTLTDFQNINRWTFKVFLPVRSRSRWQKTSSGAANAAMKRPWFHVDCQVAGGSCFHVSMSLVLC